MFRSSTFDRLLDKATSNLRLEADWPTILQICDYIRQGDVMPKYALNAIKKKITNPNPHVALFGLLVLESAVKNCGSLIHDEVGTKAYMEQLREIIRTYPHEDVKNKILELIQAWAYAFRNNSKYRAVQDTLNIMKTEGYAFPALKESDAMFCANTAPEWADGDCCHRCRVQFGVVQRKHHCRACGQVFCAQCSSRTCALPKFGIEKEVRVCDLCYDKQMKPIKMAEKTPKQSKIKKPTTTQLIRKTKSIEKQKKDELSVDAFLKSEKQASTEKSEDELREEEELQLALALSQSEAESKKHVYRHPQSVVATKSSPPALQKNEDLEKDDPELAKYLNRSYWEKKAESKDKVQTKDELPNVNNITREQNGGIDYDTEMEDFVTTLRNQVEIFVNRMKSNSSRGRSIANDSSIQTLFLNITAMHSKLLHYIQEEDDARVYYEGLQDKLNQVKDARAALDALREEHKERLRQEAEIAERQRQIQMAHKLQIMRLKKQEYLQYQRQLALQRICDEELELHMRQEQQKQHYRSGMYGAVPPYGTPQPGIGVNSIPPGVVSTGPYITTGNIPTSLYSAPYSQSQQAHIPGSVQMHPSQVFPGQQQHVPQYVMLKEPQDQIPPQEIRHGPSDQMIQSMPVQDQIRMIRPQEQLHPVAVMPGQPPLYQPMHPHEYGMSSQLPPGVLPQGMVSHQQELKPAHTSPLPSPSSSSEHSVIRQGPPAVPSAPSAASTPQPVEKEDVAELISFD